jgi:hypothetical protein
MTLYTLALFVHRRPHEVRHAAEAPEDASAGGPPVAADRATVL